MSLVGNSSLVAPAALAEPGAASHHGRLVGLPAPATHNDLRERNRASDNGSQPGAPLQCFGRYVLVELLGRGGMAEVFRALAIGTAGFRRQVVLKRILPHLSREPYFIRMFMDEAAVCGRLQHPNVIQVHDFGQESGTFFLAMEHVHGRHVGRIVARLGRRRTLLPADLVAEMSRQVCLGLAYSHALAAPDGRPLHIVHRDISPSNIVVAFSGVVKVLDFGIARIARDVRLSRTTEAGQLKGKAAYMAPEQYLQAEIDGRTDLFSLGVVMHEALTGRRLFQRDHARDVMAVVLEMDIPRPSHFNRAVPPLLDAIVMRALARDPRDRFAGAAEMAEALEAFLVERRFPSHALPEFMARLYGDEAAEPPLPAESEIQAAVERARQETEPTSAVELTTSRPRAVGPRAGTACSEARSGSGDPPRRRSRLPAVFGLAGAALALGLASFVLFGWSLRDREEVANPTAESAPSEAAPVLPAAAAPVAEPVPGDEPPALPAAGVRQPDQMARPALESPPPETRVRSPAPADKRPALESPPPETRVRSPAPADKRPALRKHPAQRKALAAPPPAPRAGKIRYGIPVDPFR